jgi:hypothetical protein
MSPREDQKRSLIDVDGFVSGLRRQWPASEVSVRLDAPVYVVSWTVALLHGDVAGGFSHNGQTIGLDGDVTDCADVALWFRALVGPEPRLWIYDEGYNFDVEVTPTTTVRDIVRAFVDDDAR